MSSRAATKSSVVPPPLPPKPQRRGIVRVEGLYEKNTFKKTGQFKPMPSQVPYTFAWDKICAPADTKMYPMSLKSCQIDAVTAAFTHVMDPFGPHPDPHVRIDSSGGKTFSLTMLVLRQEEYLRQTSTAGKIVILTSCGAALDNIKDHLTGQDPRTVTKLASLLRLPAGSVSKHLSNEVYVVTSETKVNDIANHTIIIIGYQIWHAHFDVQDDDTEEKKQFKQDITEALTDQLYYTVIDEYSQFHPDKGTNSVSSRGISALVRENAFAGYCGFTADKLNTKPIYDGPGVASCKIVAHRMQMYKPDADKPDVTVPLKTKQEIHEAIHKFPEMAPFMMPFFRQLQEFIQRHNFPAKAIIFRDGVGKDRQDFCDHANATMIALKIMHPIENRPLRFIPYDRNIREKLWNMKYDFLVDDSALRQAFSEPDIFFVYIMKSGSSFNLFKQMVNRATRRYREEDPNAPKKYPVFSDTGYDQVAHIYYFEPMEKHIDRIKIPKFDTLADYYREQDRLNALPPPTPKTKKAARTLTQQQAQPATPTTTFSDLQDLADFALDAPPASLSSSSSSMEQDSDVVILDNKSEDTTVEPLEKKRKTQGRVTLDEAFFARFHQPGKKTTKASKLVSKKSSKLPKSSQDDEEGNESDSEYEVDDEAEASEYEASSSSSDEDSGSDEDSESEEEDKKDQAPARKKMVVDKKLVDKTTGDASEVKSRKLTTDQLANFIHLFTNPPVCKCGKKLALFKGLQQHIPKQQESAMREMTEANGFAFATFYTRGKGNIGRAENCANCVYLAKCKLAEDNKDKNLECEKCHCRLYFDEDALMRSSLSNPTIRAKRNYGRVKLAQVKQKGIFQSWNMKLQCAGGCQKKPQGVCFADNAKSGQYLLENWNTHGKAMNQVFDQHLNPEERKQVQKQVETTAIKNVCKSLGVESSTVSGISFYNESLVQDKSLCVDPYDRAEMDNFKLIVNKIKQYVNGEYEANAVDQRRILRMLVLIKFCAVKYENNNFDIDAVDFGKYAQEQGWWIKHSNHLFSEQFLVSRFSAYGREDRHSNVHIVDTTEHPLKWKLPKRVWGRLYPFLKNTVATINNMVSTNGTSYLEILQDLRAGPTGWGEYKAEMQRDIPDAPPTPCGPMLSYVPTTPLPPTTPVSVPMEQDPIEEEEPTEVDEYQIRVQREVQRITKSAKPSRFAKLIRKAIARFGTAAISDQDFERLALSVKMAWFSQKFNTVKSDTNSTYCSVFPLVINAGRGMWKLNPVFFE